MIEPALRVFFILSRGSAAFIVVAVVALDALVVAALVVVALVVAALVVSSKKRECYATM